MLCSGDTRPCDALVDAAADATLLIHEATFEDPTPEADWREVRPRIPPGQWSMRIWRSTLALEASCMRGNAGVAMIGLTRVIDNEWRAKCSVYLILVRSRSTMHASDQLHSSACHRRGRWRWPSGTA